MRCYARAKINLALDVLGKREDGYHNVRMIMQSVSLSDTLDMAISEEKAIHLTVSEAGGCDQPGSEPENIPDKEGRNKDTLTAVPSDERNLVYRAAKLLMDEFHIDKGISLHLTKSIPVAAGMAGGSSDAAAALKGLNSLFDLGLSIQELMERGVKIGADVPYCILGGTALAEGIGEILTPLPSLPACHILIAKPSVSVSTREAYENLDLQSLLERPDIDGMIDAVRDGDTQRICRKMMNVFEPGIQKRHPVIGRIRALMEECGAQKAMMSGSGPTVFGVFDDEDKLREGKDRLLKSRLAENVMTAEIV